MDNVSDVTGPPSVTTVLASRRCLFVVGWRTGNSDQKATSVHSSNSSRFRRRAVATALAASTLLAACGSDASTRSVQAASTTSTAGPAKAPSAPASTEPTATTEPATTEPATTATAAPVTAPAVPAGVTLRVGDQLDYLKTVLSLSGQDKDFPYALSYGSFVGGPPMLQAFQAGDLDAGFIGTTPLIFAQAAGLDLVGVAGWASSKQSSYGLVTAPGVTGISGWADLKGKSIAYQRGTAGEAVLLEALASVGLKASDVTTVDVSQINVRATLEGKSADVGLEVEPLTSGYLADNPTAKLVARADQLPDRTSILISTKKALDDAGKSAALADYAVRVVHAFAYLRAHQDELASGVYVKIYGLTPERAAALVQENGTTSFFAVPGDLLAPQQKLADLFLEAGQVPSKVDVSGEFDPRLNDLVLATQAAS